jgi:hypothetical protein
MIGRFLIWAAGMRGRSADATMKAQFSFQMSVLRQGEETDLLFGVGCLVFRVSCPAGCRLGLAKLDFAASEFVPAVLGTALFAVIMMPVSSWF